MRRIETRRGRAIAWLIGIFALFVVLATHRLTRPVRPAAATAALRDTVLALRAAADACRRELDENAASFESYAAGLDSLRERMHALEAIDPRGVPADSYSTYMDAFDAYNDSVPGWSAQADTLRAHWERCTEVTRSHNMLADSLRRWMIRLDSLESRT